jgi:sialate O-acetylesterase
MRIALMALCIAGVAAADASSRPLLHPLFSDRAVLQRERPVAIWGWAAPGAAVTVALSGSGLVADPVIAKAADNGRWQAAIGPFAAGGPYTLAVSAGERKAEAKDILIGDVWLCGGQSNMEFAVSKAKDFETEKAKADLPQVRHLSVPMNFADTPQETFRGAWQVCTPDSVGRFTAVGYFMARTLHADLGIPIGLVHSSVGGTYAEAWTSAEALATLPDQAQALADWKQLTEGVRRQRAETGKDYPALLADWYQINDPGTAAKPAWKAADLDDQAWGKVKLPAILEEAGAIPKTWDGTVWLRRTVDVPAAEAGKAAKLALGHINGHDVTWIAGKRVGEADGWNTRAYQIPAGVLTAGANSIALRILNRNGPCGPSEAMALTFADGVAVPLNGSWRIRPGVELGKAAPLPLRLGKNGPTGLFNGMIAPLAPMSLAGVAWYQGENNSERAYQYRDLLPALIADWRGRFGRDDLPFLIVSLANYHGRKDKPGESAWAELREAQALTARRTPRCGMAVAIDLGETWNIHPLNKQEVGRRLALAAEAIACGKPVEWSGPWYTAMAVEGAAIRLRFDHLGGGLVASDGAALAGFAIAGEDHAFVWATARIDGDTVVVSSPDVPKPVAVRYAWADDPACNLANRAGLPAVPFRTDEWPGVTWPHPPTEPGAGK